MVPVQADVSPADQVRILGVALCFDLVDLEANRQGWMSQSQRLRRLLPGTVTLIVAGVSALVVAFGDWLVPLAAIAIGVAIVAAVFVFLVIVSDAVYGRVRALDAIVMPLTERTSYDYGSGEGYYTEDHYLWASGWEIAVNARVLNALAGAGGIGKRYRLYRAVWGGRLMSMEPLPDLRAPIHQPWSPS